MHVRPWTFSGRGGREEVTWWEPSSTSTMKNGFAGVRPQWRGASDRKSCWHNLTFFSILCPDSGVGAGIDSYYEYLMKAYILLGDNVFLDRFNIVSPPVTVSMYLNLLCCPHHCGHIFTHLFMSLLSYMCAPALQCHYEVHQPASSAAQRTHAQSHRECSQLDGLSAGVLPRSAGQESSLHHVE